LVVVLSSANIKLEPLADLCSVVWHCMSCRVSFIICLSCLRLLFHFISFYFILSCFIHLYPFAVLQDHFLQLHLVWRGANWGHSAGGVQHSGVRCFRVSGNLWPLKTQVPPRAHGRRHRWRAQEFAQTIRNIN
jgi:hypothetical protein